ncbi:hypothetical protein O7626_26265 [Micromonospora sp. WMMD1102]|uniref:hypothetical protein n=1 Tax=Micromonospora sp. WMMD1102 TaxID=3016105 RepID=UPI00241563BD|nr:hypothetical protein [Micromonospora sp. WMMD1102]MDG4789387.1 hypothetical protein [Micromonospora sp. WMMD1102]
MTFLTPRRVLAVVLLLIAFVALAASRTFPILDDLSGVAKSAITIAGAACALVGAWLWVRKASDQP